MTRAQSEIVKDIATGAVPADVQSFAALHDYTDANCYAGCCEDSTVTEQRGLDLWNSVFPRVHEDDEEVVGSEVTLDAMNEMHSRLDQWLRSGIHIKCVGFTST